MDAITRLAEQHITESQSRLKHIDEMMARAKQSQAQAPMPTEVVGRLAQIQQDRDKLAKELSEISAQPQKNWQATATRGEGIKRLLTNVGLELEKAVTAIFEPQGHQAHNKTKP